MERTPLEVTCIRDAIAICSLARHEMDVHGSAVLTPTLLFPARRVAGDETWTGLQGAGTVRAICSYLDNTAVIVVEVSALGSTAQTTVRYARTSQDLSCSDGTPRHNTDRRGNQLQASGHGTFVAWSIPTNRRGHQARYERSANATRQLVNQAFWFANARSLRNCWTGSAQHAPMPSASFDGRVRRI